MVVGRSIGSTASAATSCISRMRVTGVEFLCGHGDSSSSIGCLLGSKHVNGRG